MRNARNSNTPSCGGRWICMFYRFCFFDGLFVSLFVCCTGWFAVGFLLFAWNCGQVCYVFLDLLRTSVIAGGLVGVVQLLFGYWKFSYIAEHAHSAPCCMCARAVRPYIYIDFVNICYSVIDIHVYIKNISIRIYLYRHRKYNINN